MVDWFFENLRRPCPIVLPLCDPQQAGPMSGDRSRMGRIQHPRLCKKSYPDAEPEAIEIARADYRDDGNSWVQKYPYRYRRRQAISIGVDAFYCFCTTV